MAHHKAQQQHHRAENDEQCCRIGQAVSHALDQRKRACDRTIYNGICAGDSTHDLASQPRISNLRIKHALGQMSRA